MSTPAAFLGIISVISFAEAGTANKRAAINIGINDNNLEFIFFEFMIGFSPSVFNFK